MDLAKPGLDIGLYVSDAAASRAFYEDTLGLPYEELLPVGGGVRQHRLALRGSVLKLNESRNELPEGAPTGYRRLLIATADGQQPRDLVDPDGTAVSLVAKGTDCVDTIGIEIATADVARHGRFLTEALGATPLATDTFRVGTTVVKLVADDAQPSAGPLAAVGWRYLTVQVRDVTEEHGRIIGLGYDEAMPPRKLGDVAAISFVRDPGGNWLEISQRASLTGDLPDHV